MKRSVMRKTISTTLIATCVMLTLLLAIFMSFAVFLLVNMGGNLSQHARETAAATPLMIAIISYLFGGMLAFCLKVFSPASTSAPTLVFLAAPYIGWILMFLAG